MADPLDYLPYAIAAHRGRIDGHEAGQLVAAGLTLLQRSAPLVRALAGRRAAILLPTSAPFITALAASDGRGTVLVNPLAAPTEIAAQFADAGVGAAFTSAALAPRLPAGTAFVLLDDAPRSARVVVDGTATDVDLGSHFGLELEGARDAEGADDECAIVYTSAMRGRALGAVLTHRNLLANARSTARAAAQSADDHVLALLPWSHLFGLTVTATAPLLTGARVTTMDRFNPMRAVELLADGGITEVVAVPAVFTALLAAIARRGGSPASDLRLAICGGAPLDRELQDRWHDATGVELRQGYGLTEAGPVCLFNDVAHPNVRGALGTPLPGVEVLLSEPGDAIVPVRNGADGELVVRGANVFAGYVSCGASGLARSADGWLRTGDLARRRPDGTFEFRGVLKPMFTRNGFNIYPAELARVIGELDGVRAVRVQAIPEPARENDIGITVEGDVTEAAVRGWCEATLSAYKQPSSIVIR